MRGVPEAVRILHVEDGSSFAERVATTLEAHDRFDVVPVSDRETGIDRLRSETFDCVISGYELPEDDAFEFLRSVAELRPELPLIACLDGSNAGIAGDAIEAGATDCFREDGEEFDLLATRVRNAVARARAERRLDDITKHTHHAFAVFMPDLEWVQFVDDTHEAVWGHSRDRFEGSVTGFLEGVHSEDRDDIRESLERVASGESVTETCRVHGDSSDDRWVNVRGEPIVENGEIRRLVVSATDVTDSMERRRELQRRNQRLEEFAEVLTHDLRNPLNIAAGYLEVVRESPDEDAIEKCSDAMERIDSLIEEVRASVLQDRTEPEERPVDLGTVASEAWSTVDTGEATFEVSGETRIRADPDQLRRLLENLFRNAVEHGARDDAADLTVRVVALEDGFAVDDDGIGLSPDVADSVFDRGFTTAREGTGFGLSIVRNIAESHGWDVTAGESPAGGARFRFSQVLRSAESVIEMEAGGADIWGEADQGHFYHEPIRGDFDVRVNVPLVENTHAWAKGGIMVRTSADPGAPHIFVRRRPNGSSTVQWRPVKGIEARSLTSNLGRTLKEQDESEHDHDWLRLVRDDDTFRAYTSATGEEGEWTLLVELTESVLELPKAVVLGLAGTSHDRVESTTIRFKHLEGVEPIYSVDLDDPIRSGDIRTLEPRLVDIEEPAGITPTGMTLRGVVETPERIDDLDVRFEYREVTAEEWSTTDARGGEEPNEIRATVTGLQPRRYYDYRIVVDYDGTTLERAATHPIATPGESPGATATGPESAAPADPDDGFADLAPWLEDDTPIVTVTEPDRDQLATACSIDGPRVVVFETSGTIDLEERDVTITNERCWIAGQTAPSPGITLIRGRLMVAADDCVLQHLRVRPGDAGLTEDDGFPKEGIQTDDETGNVIVDHCTTTWGVKENQSIGNSTTATTFSNCLIAEGLWHSIHPKGERAYGTLIGDHAEDVALLGNLWAHNADWNPRLKGNTSVVLSNNVHYHYRGGLEVPESAEATIERDVFARPVGERADVYGDGTVHTADNVHGSDDEDTHVDGALHRVPDRLDWPDDFEGVPVAAVRDAVLEHVGARPADRTAHDERLIEQVRSGDGAFVDSQEAVGGYPALAENDEPLTVPSRDLRAWLREQARSVEP